MDLKTSALRGFKGATKMFLQDLQALPDEVYGKSFGPKTRTIADIVFEVNLVNDHVGMVLRDEEPFAWPDNGWIKAPEGFSGKDVVIAAFETSTQRIVDTIESFSSEHLDTLVITEHGEVTRYNRCQFMMLHMWYHMGQLNFIQTMIGDDAWHWN